MGQLSKIFPIFVDTLNNVTDIEESCKASDRR